MFNKFHFFIFSFFHFFILTATAQDTKVADQILLYQRITGGWPKNIDMSLPLSEAEKANHSSATETASHAATSTTSDQNAATATNGITQDQNQY